MFLSVIRLMSLFQGNEVNASGESAFLQELELCMNRSKDYLRQIRQREWNARRLEGKVRYLSQYSTSWLDLKNLVLLYPWLLL